MNLHAHFWLWCLGLRPPLSTTMPQELEALVQQARGKARIAEVGVYHAATSRRFRRVMDARGTLVAVDSYYASRAGIPVAYVIARVELAKVRRGRLVFLRTTGALAAETEVVRGLAPFDLVFIDGDHSWNGLHANWGGWSPLVRVGGTIAIHDTTSGDGLRFAEEVIAADSRFLRFQVKDVTTFFRRVV